MGQFRIWHVIIILTSTWNSHNFDLRWAIYDIGTKKRKTIKIKFPRWWLHLFRSSCTLYSKGGLISTLKISENRRFRLKLGLEYPLLSLCNFTMDACKWGCPRTIPETYHSSIGPWPTLLTHLIPKVIWGNWTIWSIPFCPGAELAS